MTHTPLTQDEREQMFLSFVSDRESDYARLSRFLHDEVGQVLSAVGLQLDALRHDFGGRTPELDQRAVEIQEMLETIIERIRDVSYELNPSVVQRIGLPYALERLTARLRTGFSGTLRAQLDNALRIAPDRAEGMYRAVEAALELAIAAPDCNQIDLQLKRTRTGAVLEVRANARVDFQAASSYPALLMTYYANRNKIDLAVIPAGEKDTIVRFSCPAAT